MTDKEIIINGVDVSKCEYRDWRNFCCCNNSKENEGEERVTGRGGCKYNPNCHYKQLKRKGQELRTICKEFDIEYIIDKETGSLISRCNKLNKKEQECEELKKELQAQRNFTTQEQRKIYCVAYDKTCETGNECKQKKCVFKDRLKYKQALDEIRQYRVCEINDEDGEEGDVILGIIDEVEEQ